MAAEGRPEGAERGWQAGCGQGEEPEGRGRGRGWRASQLPWGERAEGGGSGRGEGGGKAARDWGGGESAGGGAGDPLEEEPRRRREGRVSKPGKAPRGRGDGLGEVKLELFLPPVRTLLRGPPHQLPSSDTHLRP